MDLEYQLRIRNAANSADVLTVTSVRSGTNPYLTTIPSGDAQKIDPRTGRSSLGVYSVRLADVDIGSSQRLLTSLLEDANQRQQLSYRIAVIEFRENGGAWQVLIAGPITGLDLVSDIEWQVTVSDPMQSQTVKKMFSASSDTLITDFLTTWPLRGCLLGGPIKGATSAVFNMADLGGWKMRVETSAIATEYFLRPVNIYGPPVWHNPQDRPSFEQLAQTINEAAAAIQIPQLDGRASPWSTIEDSQANAWGWNGLTILIDDVPWKPLIYDYNQSVDGFGVVDIGYRLVNYGYHGQEGIRVKSDGVKTLTNGQIVRVRALTVLPTEISPIYLVDHPIEILKTFWTSAGIAFSSTDCTAMKELIGTDARYALRITSARALSDIADQVCLPYGIGLRGNSAGEIVPFDARLGRSATAPAVTIGDADVEKGSVKAFALNPGDAITQIVFRSKRFVDQRTIPIPYRVSSTYFRGTSIVDGVNVSDVELTVVNDEAGALTFGDTEMSFEGMILGASSTYAFMRDFIVSIARRIFDRWGRGSQAGKALLLRTGAGAAVQLGDEIFFDVSAMPNHNYRLGDNALIAARAMQVVQRTVVPKGLQVELDDSGLSLQPPATLPTVSVAASSDMPRTVAQATVTNAATLNAAGIGARLQIAFGATSTRFFDVMAWTPGKIPAGAVRLPLALAGTTVYVRARSEVPGARPSNWSSSANVTLTGISAPTSVTGTPVGADGSLCDVTWSTGSGSNADLVDVFLRLNGESFSQAVLATTLIAGSNRYQLAGLTPGTAYIVTVRHRDPSTQDVSAAVDASFTSSGTGVTLSAPTDPNPFAASPSISRLSGQNTLNAGLYGIAVAAAHVPGELEIAEAIETGVGAGTYGSYSSVGRISAVSGNWTLWQNVAPNDGLRRKLKARSVRDGTTASAYSSEVVATPWTYQALPAYPGDALVGLTAVVTALYVSAVDYALNEVTVSWVYSGDLGAGTFELWRIVTASATADLSGSQSNRGTTSGASPASIVDAVPDDIISTAGPKVTYSYQVRVLDGSGTLLRATEWMSVTYSHA